MSPEETIALCRLVKAVCPSQALDQYTPDAWALILRHIDYNDAKQAVIDIASQPLEPGKSRYIEPGTNTVRYPRIVPKDDTTAAFLKKRTLTNLYNQHPAWLVNAHRALDEAVAAAYGWPVDLSDEDVLRRLLALNLERADAVI